MALGILFTILFACALALVYILMPLTIAYYLYSRKFMSDKLRYLFALALVFNVLFIIILVLLDLGA